MFGPQKLSVVIPAFNEARTIEDIVGRALSVVEDVIVVDDGSTDGTADLASAFPVTVLRHQRNEGKGASLIDGFRTALEHGADAVITLDGDGQHPSERIPDLVDRARSAPGCIVVGSRLHDRAAFPPARYRANRIANFWISWASGHLIDDSQCGFRLYPREALEAIRVERPPKAGFVFESEALIDAARAGHRTVSVPIPALYGDHTQRPSHFRPVRDILAIVLMVAGKLFARGMYPHGLVRSLGERYSRG